MSQQPVISEPELPRHLWGLFLLVGVLLILLGFLAIVFSFFSGLATVMVYGALLLVSGVIHGIAVFQARTWNGVFLHLLMAVLGVAVGFFCLSNTETALRASTLLLAIFLVVGGLFRIFGAMLAHRRGWMVTVLSGVVGVLLGLLIWKMPNSDEWVIGTFVGVDLLFQGFS